MLEEDLVEAIIALPSQLFYNTDIGIYAFILSKKKDHPIGWSFLFGLMMDSNYWIFICKQKR